MSWKWQNFSHSSVPKAQCLIKTFFQKDTIFNWLYLKTSYASILLPPFPVSNISFSELTSALLWVFLGIRVIIPVTCFLPLPLEVQHRHIKSDASWNGYVLTLTIFATWNCISFSCHFKQSLCRNATILRELMYFSILHYSICCTKRWIKEPLQPLL